MLSYFAVVTEVFTVLPLLMGDTGKYFWCAVTISAVRKSMCKASAFLKNTVTPILVNVSDLIDFEFIMVWPSYSSLVFPIFLHSQQA